MKPARTILARLLVLGMLAPLLSLALSCQVPGMNTMAAMRCCRQMHSRCMQGAEAGSMACCHQLQPQPAAALLAAATEAVAAPPALLHTGSRTVPAAPAAAHLRAFAALSPPTSPGPRLTSLRI